LLKNFDCGELRADNTGSEVTLAGWVNRRRDHGGVIFIDLRDRSGIIQCVFNPAVSAEGYKVADELRSEYVVQVKGKVSLRPEGTQNPDLPTGAVEVMAEEARILNTSRTPPFYINEDTEVEEGLRLKYRYLDLRRERMKDNLILRHRIVKYIRDYLDKRGFIEIETPVLIKSTPEGARDYLVPSRLHPHQFYALPQSPQQLKQLLMVGGIEKYFQIVKCFRDEDSRADRQPEFTQLDLEMSFIEREDILNLIEDLMTNLMQTVKPEAHFPRPFPRLSFVESMASYGCDKPNLCFGMKIRDFSAIAAQCDFAVFKNVLSQGGAVKGICAPGCATYTRGQLGELNEFVKKLGAPGLLTISLGERPGNLDNITPEQVKSVAARYINLDQIKEIGHCFKASTGDLLLVVAGRPEATGKVLGELRTEMARRLNLLKPNEYTFAFVLDFPAFEKNPETGRWQAVHHPFTAPMDEDLTLLDADQLEKVRAKSYDIVCNGYEIGGGSLRIYNTEMQKKVFRILGYNDAEMQKLFGHLLEAFSYGAPPHGGIAVGIDRLTMLLAGAETIREVIAFPKNQQAQDVMFDAPSEVTPEQLAELHIGLKDNLPTNTSLQK
jgi:aspartyl-tRNA synthetase